MGNEVAVESFSLREGKWIGGSTKLIFCLTKQLLLFPTNNSTSASGGIRVSDLVVF